MAGGAEVARQARRIAALPGAARRTRARTGACRPPAGAARCRVGSRGSSASQPAEAARAPGHGVVPCGMRSAGGAGGPGRRASAPCRWASWGVRGRIAAVSGAGGVAPAWRAGRQGVTQRSGGPRTPGSNCDQAMFVQAVGRQRLLRRRRSNSGRETVLSRARPGAARVARPMRCISAHGDVGAASVPGLRASSRTRVPATVSPASPMRLRAKAFAATSGRLVSPVMTVARSRPQRHCPPVSRHVSSVARRPAARCAVRMPADGGVISGIGVCPRLP